MSNVVEQCDDETDEAEWVNGEWTAEVPSLSSKVTG